MGEAFDGLLTNDRDFIYNEHHTGGEAAPRLGKVGDLHARALPSSRDVSRCSWAMDRANFFLFSGCGYRSAEHHPATKQPGSSRNKRSGGSGAAKPARLSAPVVDISASQSADPDRGRMLLEQHELCRWNDRRCELRPRNQLYASPVIRRQDPISANIGPRHDLETGYRTRGAC